MGLQNDALFVFQTVIDFKYSFKVEWLLVKEILVKKLPTAVLESSYSKNMKTFF